MVQIVIRICTLHYCASKKIFNCERMEGKWLDKWIIYICLNSNVSVAVSVLHWFHLNLHYATYFASRFCCNPILLQNCRWLVLVGRGGLGAEGPACNSSYVVPGRGRWGSPVSLSHTGLSCSLQSSLQLHMRRSTSITGRPGRESGTTTFVEYDLGLSSCYVRNSATVQLPIAGIPTTLLFRSVTLVIIAWSVELIVL